MDAERPFEVGEVDRTSKDVISAADALLVDTVGDKGSVAEVEGRDRSGSSPRGFPSSGRKAGQASQRFRYSVPLSVVYLHNVASLW